MILFLETNSIGLVVLAIDFGLCSSSQGISGLILLRANFGGIFRVELYVGPPLGLESLDPSH